MNPELRWRQRLENLNRSFKHFELACKQNHYSELELAGLIKSYELTFELCWKTLKDYLQNDGIDAKTPREIIKKSYQVALIENVDQWLEALDVRNQFSLIYDEQIAKTAVPYVKETLYPMIQLCVKMLNEKK
ncbi:MAG: nucleotidyltransferase substrate binding protein [Planctomycetaceae bacterium]|jgi:nucleotidyltransferase substrate binding protein (TIGR01987 family)|nr:nucleotidyltransferase substrate binding protein [Planctomycetaceae bacterium]